MRLEVPITEAKEQPSPFWRFSLALYPSVAETCLDLQDTCSVDVNVLLFLLWAARRGRALGPEDVGHVTAAAEGWHRSVVVPLRAVRRALRTPPALVEAKPAERLRQRIKQVELEAERLQQEGLYQSVPLLGLGKPEPSREAAATANLAAYAAALGTRFPEAATEALVAAMARLGPEQDM